MASSPPRNRRAVAAAAGTTHDGPPARATRTRTSSSRRELVMSEILEHATRLFAERGYDGTTLQDIADAIGITRPGLYNYISSKEQLLAELVRDVSENTAHIVRAVRLRTDLSSVEKLRIVVRTLVLQRAGAPERFRVLDRTEAALPEEVAALHLKSRREVLAEVRTIIEEGISTVSKEIPGLLRGTTVTTASSLASEVTGSVASAEKLVNDLGRWLSVLVLIAAFAVACLLTMAAVARRVREFGTLKAIGWRSRRIVAQVLGESMAMGVAGAAAGVGLGLAGAAIIAAVSPKLSAMVGGNSGPQASAPPGARRPSPDDRRREPVPRGVRDAAPVGYRGVIVLAVILAIAGGLLAGAFASWRIARLRPADALARVA